jgi:Mg-chelatase subunit ChlI
MGKVDVSMATRASVDEGRPVYPFTAIVGQGELKMALILNTIDPSIGGVLLSGPKGTGKSSIVRAVEEIFPAIDVVADCVFRCNPFDSVRMCDDCRSRFVANQALPKIQKKAHLITLPLSATEDRVIGSLDVEAALLKGVKALQPGILAEANQNSLYIDEVNLLPDHLVDMILDVSASGWNVIEREGMSVTHPSRFILVGSMNPEEGALRPQILDRFGLHAKAQRLLDPMDRMEVIRRSEAFLRDPLAFRKTHEPQQAELRRRINVARDLLPRVQAPQSVMESIAKICTRLQVDGYRPDIVMIRAAKALAAFNDREIVLPDDLLMASNLALSHRTRKSGQIPPPTTKEIQKAFKVSPIGENPVLAKLGRLRKVGQLLALRKLKRIPLLAVVGGVALILALFFAPFFPAQQVLQFFIQISGLHVFFSDNVAVCHLELNYQAA